MRVLHVSSAGNIQSCEVADPSGPSSASSSSFFVAAKALRILDFEGNVVPPTTNVIAVESRKTTDPTGPDPIGPSCLSQTSKTPGDISAIGAQVWTFAGPKDSDGGLFKDGTSFAAPQVAGVAAQVWALNPQLTVPELQDWLEQTANRDAAANASDPECASSSAQPALDAYAALLNSDPAVDEPAPMRLRAALLDVDSNHRFDEGDIDAFLQAFDEATMNDPQKPDYSRYDLNGDGYTGGSHTVPFDLDRTSAFPQYSTLTKDIEGMSVSFDEGNLTDVDILCYYAYSPLFAGSEKARTERLQKRCSHPPIQIIAPTRICRAWTRT
jgi:subtilisin family serine protease